VLNVAPDFAMLAALHRLLIRTAIAVALVSAAPVAVAQTMTISTVIGRTVPLRNTAQKPFWVSRADCLAQDKLSWGVNMVGFTGLTLQVWAGNNGVDCTAVNERQPGGSAECWLVYSTTPTVSPLTVNIPAVDIVARNTPDTTPENKLGYPAACNQTDTPIGQQLTLYFMFISSGTTITGMAQQVTSVGYDLSAPAAPTTLSVSAGETRLHLDWQGTVTNDTTTFRFYCDPPPGALQADGGVKTTSLSNHLGTLALGDGGLGFDTGGVTGFGGAIGLGGDFGLGGTFGTGADTSTSGGTGGSLGTSAGGSGGTSGAGGISDAGGTGGTTGVTDTGGTAGTTSVGTSCSSTSIIQPGVDPVYPTPLDAYECGSVSGNIANRGTATNLVNNVNYVVAVSAVDLVGNASPLSSTACGTPVEVTDFYELYRQAGGKAGGGICSLSRIPNPGSRTFVAALGVLAVIGVGRRVRRRRR
jgi:hypothetical protein